MKSPQTTVAAVLTLVIAVITLGVMPLVDSDPTTTVNLEGISAAAIVAYGFWKSRDQRQHEKDAGK